VADHPSALPLLGLPGSVLLAAAERRGVPVVADRAYADPAYTPAGTLVSRREPGAVLHDPQAVAERLVAEGRITAVDGTEVELEAESVCVHGDSPGAVAMASEVRRALEEAGVTLTAFTTA